METNPPKWRETCDPFALSYRAFRPEHILGYPHARNDVFHMLGQLRGERVEAYVKAARWPDSAVAHEAALLKQLDLPELPRLIDGGDTPAAFSVTLAMPGERLSVILGDNDGLPSVDYMASWGETLARLHSLTPDCPAQADRRFRHGPDGETLDRLGLGGLRDFFANPPAERKCVFCHGDFHYANVLFQGKWVSAVLDLELAGYGDRDADIAWALFLRPGQRFLRTQAEVNEFLEGYAHQGECNPEAVRFHMARYLVHFLDMCGRDEEYAAYIHTWLRENCR